MKYTPQRLPGSYTGVTGEGFQTQADSLRACMQAESLRYLQDPCEQLSYIYRMDS